MGNKIVREEKEEIDMLRHHESLKYSSSGREEP